MTQLKRWILPFLSAVLFAQASPGAVVNVDDANLRSGPGLENSVIVKLDKGSVLRLVEQQGNWSLGQTEDNRVGWVQTRILTLTTDDKAAPAVPAPPLPDSSGATPAPPESKPSPTPVPDTSAPVKPVEEEAKPEPTPEPLSRAPYRPTFKELTLAIRPGYAMALTHPPGVETHGLMVGGHVSLFLLRYVAIHAPFTYTRYSSRFDFYSIGGGPLVRFLDWGPVRASADGNALYVRGVNHNHFGWSVGGDLTFGFRERSFKPFLGPFVRYERVKIAGPDLGSLCVGLSINLTNPVELD